MLPVTTFFAAFGVSFVDVQVSRCLGEEQQRHKLQHGRDPTHRQQVRPHFFWAHDLAVIKMIKHELQWVQQIPAKWFVWSLTSYFMPIIWPITFPSPMKMEPVSVKNPLSFFGELSPRYMRWTLRPRPGGRQTKPNNHHHDETFNTHHPQQQDVPTLYP